MLSRKAVMERANFDPSDFAIERELLNRRKWMLGVLFRAAPFQNRWHRKPPNADPVPHVSVDLASYPLR